MIKDKSFLIVGLGLLGGSMAMGLKKCGHKVYATDIDENAIEYALQHSIIDAGSTKTDPRLIGKADVIISGLYPSLIVNWIAENQQHIMGRIQFMIQADTIYISNIIQRSNL